ncbi:AMP-binding protein [Pokkaliibacter sp. MBI-7]|uniref:AMP-binding protein n=1 Tax=Pokkaliibacter sp. MBI-7 TaxID=3040600 RepID=UPI00244D2F5B|nr:AMP-binding protein [Pokkaliibacter sp. MBI-7]MDH2431299.1 AMP-binding protein [Pokkaliibacter sp. MBI-7]
MTVSQTLDANWSQFHSNVAVISAEGEILTYQQIASETDTFFPPMSRKELVLLVADNSPASLIAYLASLRTGRAVMLQPATIGADRLDDLITCYQPDWLWHAGSLTSLQYDEAGRSLLHPELAVLLSTSGSTGSPKQVRLSYTNIHANAHSIASYLQLTPHERPLAHLPMSYSYGLSVINSHLLVGATVLLTADSMMERRFWQFCREQQATSLSGVPYHYEMLERLRFQRMDLPALITLTQAGGRLASDKVKAWAEWSRNNGKCFIPMYGQTEATARISYLPAERVLEFPQCIGIAIPDGQLQLQDEDGAEITAVDQPGELIYQGPNVMMGYASGRDDLMRGNETPALSTGDIACRNSRGLYYIVGRKKRFIKLFGVRTSLDEVEQRLRQQWAATNTLGVEYVACCGQDQQLCIAVAGKGIAADVLQLSASQYLGVHQSVVQVKVLEELPVTEAGKINYVLLQSCFDSDDAPSRSAPL